jgi:hypothetical protein
MTKTNFDFSIENSRGNIIVMFTSSNHMPLPLKKEIVMWSNISQPISMQLSNALLALASSKLSYGCSGNYLVLSRLSIRPSVVSDSDRLERLGSEDVVGEEIVTREKDM